MSNEREEYFFVGASYGVTIVELVISISVLIILISTVFMLVNPSEIQKRGRDKKRLSDISVLDQTINEYALDNGSYPDLPDTTRSSNALPLENMGPLVDSSGEGWIDQNLLNYTVKLPLDPINEGNYVYSYRHNDFGYELNAVLEYNTEFSEEDGGNNDNVYEMGNNLLIL